MKKISILIGLLTLLLIPTGTGASNFKDVQPGSLFYHEVTNLYSKGIIDGFDDRSFQPAKKLTRAEAAKIVADAIQIHGGTSSFPDVPADSWYMGSAAALAEGGIMGGYVDGGFKPNQLLTRAETAKVISLAFRLGEGSNPENYTDVKETEWFYPYVQTLASHHITSGKTPNTFAPAAEVTRGEFAAFIERAYEASEFSSYAINSINGSTIVISGKKYDVPNRLKGLLNDENEEILKGAVIRFHEVNGSIDSISYLMLKKNDGVLDGGSAVIDGSLHINGDNMIVKNLSMKRNFTIGKGVDSATASHVKVSGVLWVDPSSSKFRLKLENATIEKLSGLDREMELEVLNESSVKEVEVRANAAITSNTAIHSLQVLENADVVDLDSSIRNVTVQAKDEVSLKGESSIENLVIHSDVIIVSGSAVQKMMVKDRAVRIKVKGTPEIGYVVVPYEGGINEVFGKEPSFVKTFEKVSNRLYRQTSAAKNTEFEKELQQEVIREEQQIEEEKIRLEDLKRHEEEKNNPIPKSRILDVPLLNQMSAPRLYNGCEVTSLAMMLNYHGIQVTKNELAQKLPNVPLTYSNGLRGNPNDGFVGDMANGPGLSVYHGPIAQLAGQYSDKVEDLSGKDVTEIYRKVGNGLPVWIITTTHLTPVNNFQTWNTKHGKISVTFSVHSVVVTGYDEKYVYVNDPYGTKNRKVDRTNFEKAWKQMGSQAVVVNK